MSFETKYLKLNQITPETASQWINVMVRICYREVQPKAPQPEKSKFLGFPDTQPEPDKHIKAQSGYCSDGTGHIYYRAWRPGAKIMEEKKSYAIEGCVVKLERDNRTIIEITPKTRIREIGNIRVDPIPVKGFDKMDIIELTDREIVDSQFNQERLNRYRKLWNLIP